MLRRAKRDWHLREGRAKKREKVVQRDGKERQQTMESAFRFSFEIGFDEKSNQTVPITKKMNFSLLTLFLCKSFSGDFNGNIYIYIDIVVVRDSGGGDEDLSLTGVDGTSLVSIYLSV